jgi:hypothetical protein
MFSSCKKFVAVLMLILLPLSGSSALAATISMQKNDACDGMAMTVIQHHQEGGTGNAATAHAHQCKSCSINGTCHLSCIGYLAPPSYELASLQPEMRPVTPYLVSFTSVTSAPLNPPPLASA